MLARRLDWIRQTASGTFLLLASKQALLNVIALTYHHFDAQLARETFNDDVLLTLKLDRYLTDIIGS